MLYQDKNIYERKHLMSGYYLHCLDEKYFKKVGGPIQFLPIEKCVFSHFFPWGKWEKK